MSKTRRIFAAALALSAAGATWSGSAKAQPTSSFVAPSSGWTGAQAAPDADAGKAQVAAATANAVADLRGQIAAARITPTLTVGQFLQQTNSSDALNDTISRAQQIGGPRWIDDQTCQVRLEISGERVAYTLKSVAAIRPRLSPMPAAVLERRLADWKGRTFSATGTATSAEHVQGIRPVDAAEPWTNVSEKVTSEAVAEARQDAARHVMDSIRTIQLGSGGETMADVLSREPVKHAVENWVATRPVTQVRFKDDLKVELTVSTPPDDLLDTVISSAKSVPDAKVPTDPKSLEQLRQEFARRVSAAVGQADVNQLRKQSDHPQTAPQPPPAPALDLPQQPPSWIGELMQAEGTSPRVEHQSPLHTARAAENKATDDLRARINGLQLTPSQTIGDAAKQNPAVQQAIDRALLRIHCDKVDYRADGSVTTRISVDLRDVWYELQQIASP